ncbi:hypothetical protein TNIN_379261 [Trichonephila inaurata madagascariensis]|uniref:Uncharacterized protein n=1 Tax=Trichonephila inaurata madagascariensis TaxID=2747483 RepID=A0A8X6JVL1_9ARAC|nr:hypothetical protein TNIN_379261 [Trichonephila inaurata madagascariensis]
MGGEFLKNEQVTATYKPGLLTFGIDSTSPFAFRRLRGRVLLERFQNHRFLQMVGFLPNGIGNSTIPAFLGKSQGYCIRNRPLRIEPNECKRAILFWVFSRAHEPPKIDLYSYGEFLVRI